MAGLGDGYDCDRLKGEAIRPLDLLGQVFELDLQDVGTSAGRRPSKLQRRTSYCKDAARKMARDALRVLADLTRQRRGLVGFGEGLM